MDTFFCSMTHYDITMSNEIASDIDCDIIMCHDVMGTYVIIHTDVATTLIYYVLVCPIIFHYIFLKLYIKH